MLSEAFLQPGYSQCLGTQDIVEMDQITSFRLEYNSGLFECAFVNIRLQFWLIGICANNTRKRI